MKVRQGFAAAAAAAASPGIKLSCGQSACGYQAFHVKLSSRSQCQIGYDMILIKNNCLVIGAE